MRRFIAILMLALLSGFHAAPLLRALVSDPDSDLPACCRSHGAHGCSRLQHAAAVQSGQLAVSAPSQCPLYQHHGAATTTLPQSLLSTPAGLPALLAQRHSAQAGRAAARISQVRTRVGRGPPTAVAA